MKELSVEEKAKRYELALERCRKLYNEAKANEYASDIEDYETIFPELKESEGEKIRKSLIHLVHLYGGEFGMIDANTSEEKAIAWLEKQDSQILANSAKICKDEQKPFDYENANIHQKDFAPKVDMPRYSIGDVLCDKSCTTLNKESQSNFEITDIRNGMYICDKCSFPISQQDEYELVAKRIEQKPAWSEEDKDFLYNTLSNLTELKDLYCKDYGKVGKCIDWLKSLKERINV